MRLNGAFHEPHQCVVLPDRNRPDGQDAENVTFRQRVLAKFDTDEDGRLNASERNALRKAGSPFARKRPGFRRPRFDPATVKKYDKDGNGELDGKEARAAQNGLRAKWGALVGVYKAFEKDKPVVANLKKMESDAKSGKIKDFPPDLYGWIRGSINRAGRSNNGNRNRRPRGHILEQFDTDRNGRLDSEELRKARAAINKKKQASKPAIKTKEPAGK